MELVLHRTVLALLLFLCLSLLCLPVRGDDYPGEDGEDYPPEDDEEGTGGGGGGSGDSALGALKLDNMTLDKVVGLPGISVLVKFDQSYPYGEKEDEFKSLCVLAHSLPSFFIGEVQVSDYGDEENDDLRRRFQLKKEDFPAYLLFRGSSDVSNYAGSVTAADISAWLRRKGIKMPAVGTIAEFDEIAAKFASGSHTDSDIREAERLMAGDFKEDKKAGVYVKIMKSITNKGSTYVANELVRLEKVLAGKLSEEKRDELTQKVRILGMFALEKPERKEL